MIKASKCYSSRATPKQRYTTLIEVQDQETSHRLKNIVILPPASAANDQESDTENVPEQFVDEDRLFEPAGELEVDYSSSKESEEGISVLEPLKKCQKTTSTWKKSTKFVKDIPLVETEKLANEHPELVTKSPFQLWKEYITNDLLEKICGNILFYAKRDKNNSKFDIAIGDLLRFLGIISLSGYHSLPSQQDFWSNQSYLGIPIVSETLSSKLFLQIKSMFHLVDNHTLDGNNDKWQKLLCCTIV